MTAVILILNILFIALITCVVWQRDRSTLKVFYWPALVLKIIAGISLGLIYTHYYTVGDTFNYHKDGLLLADFAKEDAASYLKFLFTSDASNTILDELSYKQPRAMFMSKIVGVFCILTAGNYWIIATYFSILCFFCSWMLAKELVTQFPEFEIAVALSFFLFPSVVFWTSGVIKESVAMAGLYFHCYIFLRLWKRQKVKYWEWLIAFLAAWWLWNLKYYYLGVLFPVLATALIARWIYPRLRIHALYLKILAWCVIFVAPLALVSVLHPNFYPERFLEVVVTSNHEFQMISEEKDLIHYTNLEPSWFGIFRNAPLATFSALYRPTVLEVETTFQWIIALENVALLLLTVLSVRQIPRLINSKHRHLIFIMLLFILLLSTFLALSTPNFGTLSRYRVGFLPFFVLLLSIDNPLITFIKNSNAMRSLAR
jgi:hypothetical protein